MCITEVRPQLVAVYKYNALRLDPERPINISLTLHLELNTGSYILVTDNNETVPKSLEISHQQSLSLYMKYEVGYGLIWLI